MNSTTKYFSNTKNSSPVISITEKWKNDEKLILSNRCKFSVQYFGSVAIQDPLNLTDCCNAMKDLSKNKKSMKGILKISAYSLILFEKSTNDIKIDQTLKDILMCSSHSTTPFVFFYTIRDPVSEIFQLCGFLSHKEVSDRIINAIQFGLQIYNEKQAESTNYLSKCQINQMTEQSKTFKQNSLIERYQDPQASIVVSSPKIPLSKTFTDLKSIPRPKRENISNAKSIDLFPNLNPGDLFKNVQAENSGSDNSYIGNSFEDDLGSVFPPNKDFITNFPENVSWQDKLQNVYLINQLVHENKYPTEDIQFSKSSYFEPSINHLSKYDHLKSINSPLESAGWSEDIIRIEKPSKEALNTSRHSFDNFLESAIQNLNLTNPREINKK